MARLAGRQHGVLADWQLLALGFTRDAIKARVRAGRLFKVSKGVYSLTPTVLPRGRMLAAALTYGREAVLSHRAAAAIWNIGPWPTGLIDVTSLRKAKPRHGTRLHVADVKRVIKDGFPVTTPTRTLIDLASQLHPARLEEAFERAERLHLLDVAELERHARGRRGARAIKRVLADYTEPEPTRSELEREIRKLCKNHNLPLPSQNVAVLGHDVDAYWPPDLIAELDSWKFHKTRKAFEEDRAKAAKLEGAGYRVLRFTWRQLKWEPQTVARAIRRGLQMGSARPRP